MVKVHELDVCGGVAGKLSSVKGVMMHNTADIIRALKHAERLKNMSFTQLMAGFAHYYIDHEDDVRTEQTFNATYHAANQVGNYNYISIEIVGDKDGDLVQFLQAEQNAFWRAAIELRYYKLPVNRNTVRLHCELDVGTYTECPKRSMIEHGDWNSTNRQPQEAINKVKDYFIKEIKKYYDDPKLKPDASEIKTKPIVYQATPGFYEALKNDTFYLEKELKNKSSWKITKGQRFFLEDIVKVGKYTRARVRLNNDVRYITMRDDYWKLIYKTKVKKIK